MKQQLIKSLKLNKELITSGLQINEFGNGSIRHKNLCLIKPSGANLDLIKYSDISAIDIINKKIISVSLRRRLNQKLKFNLKLVNYSRNKPEFKNLKYQVILKYLSKMNSTTSDIGLCNNGKIFESGTSNILFIKKNYIFSPINKIYKGITLKFFENKLGKIIKKDILIKSLQEYD